MKDTLIYKTTQKLELYSKEDIEFIKELSQKATKERLLNLIYELSEQANNMKASTQKNIIFQAGIIKECMELDIRSEKLEVRNQEEKVAEKKTVQKQEARLAQLKQGTSKKEEITQNIRTSGKYVSYWQNVLDKIKQSGKMTMYANLIGTKGVLLNDLVLGIEFPGKVTDFAKKVIEENENKALIERIVSIEQGSRMQINCVYYGGQDVYYKYKSIRCLCDDRVNDGQSMTLDQCLSCTRYEPIIGQVYAILDESGTNITQILDDAQMSYTNLDDYIKLSRTEEMLDEKKMADIKEEIKETPKTFKDTMEEGFIMDWNNVPLETQKPNIAEYDAEGIEPNKPIIKSPNNQPKKENEFKDKREENKAYEELKFNSEDYIFGRFSKATDYTSSNSFNMSSSEARQKIVNYAKMVLERCQNGTAGYSQANRKQEINGILYHDCSSFVATAYMEAGITIGNTSFEQYPMCYSSAGGKLIKISDMDHALPGDIIFYDYSYSGPENPDDYVMLTNYQTLKNMDEIGDFLPNHSF